MQQQQSCAPKVADEEKLPASQDKSWGRRLKSVRSLELVVQSAVARRPDESKSSTEPEDKPNKSTQVASSGHEDQQSDQNETEPEPVSFSVLSSDDELEDSLLEDSSSQSEANSSSSSQSTGAATSSRRATSMAPLGCQCDQLANRLDSDGGQVTDVDLVSYKQICQMEQQLCQLEAAAAKDPRRASWRIRRPHCARQPAGRLPAQDSSSSKLNRNKSTCCALTLPNVYQLRRSSLQEEQSSRSAYYELCVGDQEQAIRRKYVWFPPSLRRLELVDQFFSSFPADQIPLQPHDGQLAAPQSGDTNTTIANSENHTTASSNSSSSSSDATSATAANRQTFRDEQIASQLLRQDISLDYCKYPMSAAAQSLYRQFVERRNCHALDVGTVVQLRHKKTDTTSSELRGVEITSGSGGGGGVTTMRLAPGQRCRRCLVRFESGQLVVMAPNFVIGNTGLHRFTPEPMSGGGGGAGESSRRPRPLSSASTRRPDASCADENNSASDSSETAASCCGGGGSAEVAPPGGASGKQQRRQKLEAASGTTAANQQNIAMFHPSCFSCSSCRQFLVDLVYCLRDNKLYCLRHYGETYRPRCDWCLELIFSDEYLKAMNENFHLDHFICRHCDTNLAGQRYVLKDERPYCIQCYELNFANSCQDCRKPIGIDSRDLSYRERHWHDTCFICNKCQLSLIDKPFGSKGDKVYCAHCYDLTFATRCDGCQNPFRAGSKKMEYRGRQWHDSCFCCCVCKNTIGSSSFIPKSDQIYCIQCYEDKYATRCTKCAQVIQSGGVTFRNEPWHRDCFTCCNCNKSLAGQRFTTRDQPAPESSAKPDEGSNKFQQPHNAYCIECYAQLFAKRCFACSKAITGLGGTRFVSFESRSWHNDCFICHDCQQSLVGKGFITDGPETILCSECARAKLK